MIVLTHWHDDHVKGAAAMVAECPYASIAFPQTLCRDEFKALLNERASIRVGNFTSGIDELIGVLRTIKPNKSRRLFANANVVLFESADLRVDALSPSHDDIENFMVSIREWADQEGSDKRLAKPARNDTSVALAVRAGPELILLGGDLEVRGTLSGWQAVHEIAWRDRGTATLFKIAHHGSITGHYNPVWHDLLVTDVEAVLTPYNRGRKKLPAPDDVSRILSHTSSAYAASNASFRKAERQHNSVERTLSEADIQLLRLPEGFGQIRFRKAIGDDNWNVEIIGSACRLADAA